MPIITIATSKNKCKYATPSETIFVNHNTRKSYVQISAVNDPNTPHPTTCMCISSQICLFWISKCVILCNGGWGVLLLRNYAKSMLPAGRTGLVCFWWKCEYLIFSLLLSPPLLIKNEIHIILSCQAVARAVHYQFPFDPLIFVIFISFCSEIFQIIRKQNRTSSVY